MSQSEEESDLLQTFPGIWVKHGLENKHKIICSRCQCMSFWVRSLNQLWITMVQHWCTKIIIHYTSFRMYVSAICMQRAEQKLTCSYFVMLPTLLRNAWCKFYEKRWPCPWSNICLSAGSSAQAPASWEVNSRHPGLDSITALFLATVCTGLVIEFHSLLPLRQLHHSHFDRT